MVKPTTYPLPFNTATVTVPDAQTYYTALKATKGFTSPVWLVALGMERRKEFNAEWCLAQDLVSFWLYRRSHYTRLSKRGR